MIMMLLPALVSATLLAGCGGGMMSNGTGATPDGIAMQPDAVPAPRFLRPSDDGGVFTMTVGRTVSLVVPDGTAPDPKVEGDSVRVVTTNNIDGSNRRERELRAIRGTHGVARRRNPCPTRSRSTFDSNPARAPHSSLSRRRPGSLDGAAQLLGADPSFTRTLGCFVFRRCRGFTNAC